MRLLALSSGLTVASIFSAHAATWSWTGHAVGIMTAANLGGALLGNEVAQFSLPAGFQSNDRISSRLILSRL